MSASLLSDETVSAIDLRRMSAEDWARVLGSDPREVARYVRSAAEHGFRAAQVVWGQMLLDGRVVRRDRAGAYRWFARAAALGSPDGLNMVGRCHELGWGVPVDHAAATGWFRRAADKGSGWGAYNLGCMLLYGDGVEHDAAAALGWFAIAAERGNAKAMGLAGRCREEGWGAARDRGAALAWYERGARAGDCWAQFNLATLLVEAGRTDDAAEWLRVSLETGTPNYLEAAGRELAAQDDAVLAEIGRDALARTSASRDGAEDGTRAVPSRLLRSLARGRKPA